MFWFTTEEGWTIYMGKDKYENEDLLKYGWPEDIWFHVDNLSSAHVYLRCDRKYAVSKKRIDEQDKTWSNHLTEELINQCCQLVKANSIEGCKKAHVSVVYTPFNNLKKTGDMDVGQVGFHKGSMRTNRKCDKDSDIVKKLDKTKTETFPDLAAEKDERTRIMQNELRAKKAKARKQDELDKKQREADKEQKSYSTLFSNAESMTSNAEYTASSDASAAVDFEDDFM